jgi:hypothetical protein
MPDKPRTKGLIARKLESADYRKRHDERYAAFKLEAQILHALERKGWSYGQLADAVNTYKSNISRDLRAGGILKASFLRISKIAGALGMTLITLLVPKEQEAAVLPKIEALIRSSLSAGEVKMSETPSTTINAGPGSSSEMYQVRISSDWNPAQFSTNGIELKFIQAPTLASSKEV